MQHGFSLRYSRFSILYGIQILFLIIVTNFILLNALVMDILIVKNVHGMNNKKLEFSSFRK